MKRSKKQSFKKNNSKNYLKNKNILRNKSKV